MKDNAPDRFKNNRRETPVPEAARPQAKATDQTIRKARHKSPARARRIVRLKLLACLLVLAAVFFFSPLFKIKTIQIQGVSRSDREVLGKAAQDTLGSHFLLFGKKALTQAALSDPYIKDAAVSANWKGTLSIDLTEYVPEYALVSRNQVHLLDRFGRVLGNGIVIPQGMTQLLDDTPPLAPGYTMYGEGKKKSVLTQYQELMEQNTSDIRFQSINLTDPTNIVLEHNGSTVELGDGAELKNRLNRAINILKALSQEDGAVTIDLRFDSAPVIRRKGET